MRCPGCGGGNVYVTDTRAAKEWRRRRYKCSDCGARFTTREIPEYELDRIVGCGGRRTAQEISQHELDKLIKVRELLRQVMDE